MSCKRKLLAFITVIALFISLAPSSALALPEPATTSASQFVDMPHDWSKSVLENAVANGLLNGTDGKILPNDNLTRAQMAAIIVRAFGATVKGDISAFPDVNPTDWFADSMAKAYQMGVIKGADGKMNPNSAITREEVFVILARALQLTPATTVNKNFTDIGNLSPWAKGETYSLINSGYINGSNGYLLPGAYITRAEFAQIIYNIVNQYYNAPGTYTTASSGNHMINTPGVTLKNITVTGDLFIGDGVGDGEVTLENVIIKGRLLIRGGGENSIIIRGSSSVSSVIVARVDGMVSVKVQDDANVEIIYIDDDSDDVRIEGSVGTVEVAASDIEVTTAEAAIESIKVTAADSKVIVGTSSTVKKIDVESTASNTAVLVTGTVTNITTRAASTKVTGSGTVTDVKAAEGATNSRIETSNTKIVVDPGVTGITGAGGAPISSGSAATNNAAGTWIVTDTANGSGGGNTTTIGITSISPSIGPVSGGTTVIMTGVNLTGAAAVTFGGVDAVSYTVDSATQITAVTPAHAAGTVDVVVTAPAGTVTKTSSFTYAAEPTVASITPSAGATAGGTTVTITGTYFTGTTAVTFGGTPAASFTVDSAAQITAIAPAHAAGAVDVVVTTPGGMATGTGAYTYAEIPAVTSLNPTGGPVAGGTPVTITGTGFTDAAAVTFGGTPAASFTVDSATQITAVAPAHAAGAVQVTVTTTGGTSTDAVNFTYYEAPAVISVAPAAGSTAGGTSVVITGANFTGTTAVTFGGVAASFTVDSAAQITATAPAHAAGAVDVAVTTPGGTSNAIGSYTYAAIPTVTSLGPTGGPVAGGTTVAITGTGFTGAAAVTFGGTPAASFTVDSATQITAVAPAHAAGAVQVTVTTTGGTSTDAVNFTYYDAPALISLTPAVGSTAGGTSVVITGTNFTGTTAVTFGGVAASFIVDSAAQITATAPAHAAGAVDVVVTTPGGMATGTGAYTYAVVPTITSLSPSGGPVAGGTTVAINGTGFTGATAVTFGGITASFIVNSATKITATAPAHAAGAVNVVVTTPGGTATGTYTYISDCYGYGYHLATLLDVTVEGGADVPFSYNGPLDDVTRETGTTFTVMESGDYLINYGVSITDGAGSVIAIAVNGTVDPSTNVSVLAAPGNITGSCVLSLSAGDAISLRNDSLTALTLATDPSVGAQLSMTKLMGSYGYGYHLATDETKTIANRADVPFSDNGPFSNVIFSADSTTFTVLETGDYLINYGVSITDGAGSVIAIAVNGTVDPSTNVSVLAAPGNMTGSCVLSLSAGDAISLRNDSTTALTLATDPSVGAQLSIMKLDNYDAYGYVYHLAADETKTIANRADVPFSNNGPFSNVIFSSTTFTVLETGDYLINYGVSITDGAGSVIAIAVNGTVDPSTNVSLLAAPGNITGSCVLSLSAGDAISLQNDSLIPLNLTIDPHVGAQLSLIKLD